MSKTWPNRSTGRSVAECRPPGVAWGILRFASILAALLVEVTVQTRVAGCLTGGRQPR
jgi:hypothetical protein